MQQTSIKKKFDARPDHHLRLQKPVILKTQKFHLFNWKNRQMRHSKTGSTSFLLRLALGLIWGLRYSSKLLPLLFSFGSSLSVSVLTFEWSSFWSEACLCQADWSRLPRRKSKSSKGRNTFTFEFNRNYSHLEMFKASLARPPHRSISGNSRCIDGKSTPLSKTKGQSKLESCRSLESKQQKKCKKAHSIHCTMKLILGRHPKHFRAKLACWATYLLK